MNESNDIRAKQLVWDLYVSRVNRALGRQRDELQRGIETTPIIMYAPLLAEFETTKNVLDKAYNAGACSSLGMIVRALDAIDNSKTKNEAILACREELQKVYEELHVIKGADA